MDFLFHLILHFCYFRYTNDGRQLRSELDGWLNCVQTEMGPARAIIAPHAGYKYCGACAAYAYKQVQQSCYRVNGP